MSEENVDLVRRAYDAFNRSDIPAVLTTFDPDIEWDMTDYEVWLESDLYRGHEGVGQFLADWASIFPDYHAVIDRIIDQEDSVVVFVTQRGHGSGSGAGAELRYVQILTVSDGKVSRVRTFSDKATALAAVGLTGD